MYLGGKRKRGWETQRRKKEGEEEKKYEA